LILRLATNAQVATAQKRSRTRPLHWRRSARTGICVRVSLRLGLGWAKSHGLHTGQTPVLKYNRQLMQAILWNKLPIAKIVNVRIINLEQAPEGYNYFDAGAAAKFVIDPRGQLPKAA
jgi:glutathione-independent formaldehyde dehydrogenase